MFVAYTRIPLNAAAKYILEAKLRSKTEAG